MNLPDTKAILPYVGLFTIVTLKPTEISGCNIPTLFFPFLSSRRGRAFVKAPSNASSNVVRIFDPFSLHDDAPQINGYIPLSPEDQAFNEERYWKLPVPAAAILAALVERLGYDQSECEDIILVTHICLRSRGAYPHGIGTGGGEGSGGRAEGWKG